MGDEGDVLEFTVEWDEPGLQAAVGAWTRHLTCVGIVFLPLALLVTLWVLFQFGNVQLTVPNVVLWVVLYTAVGLLLPLIARRAVRVQAPTQSGVWHTRYRLDGNGLELIDDAGAKRYCWNGFREACGLGDYWLLFFAPGQFVPLPERALTAERRAFILRHLAKCGCKARRCRLGVLSTPLK